MQSRLTFAALAVLILLVAVLGSWQVVAARNSQRTQIENSEVTAAHLATSALSSALSSRLELLENLTSLPTLSDIYTTKQSEATQLPAELHLLYPGFASFAVIDATGKLLGRWPTDKAVIGKNTATQPVFIGAMKTKAPFVGPARQQTAPPKEFVVSLAVPVRDSKGKIVGLLEGNLAVGTLGSIIGGTKLSGGGELVLFDQAGHALTGPGANAARSFSKLPVIAAALAGRSGAGSAQVPGFSGSRLVGYAGIASTGWAVVVELPPSVLNGPINALTERLIAIGIIVLLLAVGTAVLVGSLLRRLDREKEWQTAIMSSLGEGVATVDSDGHVTQANPALELLLGRTIGEIEGLPWDEVFVVYEGDHSLGWEKSITAEAIRTRQVISSSGYDRLIAHADGRRIPIAVTAGPLLVQGEVTGAVIVMRDVSREREVDELKSSLVSTVSHELRTPLTMIQGFSELLIDRTDLGPERSHEALDQIHTSAKRLARLIDDLLSVSRIDSGKLTADFAPVDLHGVIDEVVATFESQGRIIDVRVEEDLPRVTADRDKMIQVVTNLVSNAVKYSDAPAPIEIVAATADGRASVSVTDHGIGMSELECTQMFEKFTRADRPEVRKVGGTGLGLYITNSLVALQRGEMWVESEPGVGSVFGFFIPFSGGGTRPNGDRPSERDHVAEALDR